MARPPLSDPCQPYLAAERAWLDHLEQCAACRSSRTGRPRCPSGWVTWTAMNAAESELLAAMNTTSQLASPF